MISDAILDVLFAVVSGVVGLFPTWQLPNGPGLTVLAAANVVIPFDVLFFWLGVTIAFGIVGLVYWGIMVVVNLIRGSGA
jgi:hypothetical protein